MWWFLKNPRELCHVRSSEEWVQETRFLPATADLGPRSLGPLAINVAVVLAPHLVYLQPSHCDLWLVHDQYPLPKEIPLFSAEDIVAVLLCTAFLIGLLILFVWCLGESHALFSGQKSFWNRCFDMLWPFWPMLWDLQLNDVVSKFHNKEPC